MKKSIFLKGRQQKYHFHSLILCLCSGFAEATSAPTIKLDGKGDQEKYNISQLPYFLFRSCPRPLGRCDKMLCLLFNLLFKRWLCFGEMQRSCFFNNDAKEQWLRASFWIHGVKIVWVELFPAELCNDENCSRSSTHSRIYRWSFFKEKPDKRFGQETLIDNFLSVVLQPWIAAHSDGTEKNVSPLVSQVFP